MEGGSKKLIVEVDQAISDLLLALAPPYLRLTRQKYGAHISVIRYEWFESSLWGSHEGEVVQFTYDPFPKNDKTYYWLRVWSPRLRQIREELGLAPNRKITAPPDGEDCFHMTIGNTKNSGYVNFAVDTRRLTRVGK